MSWGCEPVPAVPCLLCPTPRPRQPGTLGPSTGAALPPVCGPGGRWPDDDDPLSTTSDDPRPATAAVTGGTVGSVERGARTRGGRRRRGPSPTAQPRSEAAEVVRQEGHRAPRRSCCASTRPRWRTSGSPAALRRAAGRLLGPEDLDILVDNAGPAGRTPVGGRPRPTRWSGGAVHVVGVVMLAEAARCRCWPTAAGSSTPPPGWRASPATSATRSTRRRRARSRSTPATSPRPRPAPDRGQHDRPGATGTDFGGGDLRDDEQVRVRLGRGDGDGPRRATRTTSVPPSRRSPSGDWVGDRPADRGVRRDELL